MSVAQIKTRSVLALLDANAAGVVPRSTVTQGRVLRSLPFFSPYDS